MTKVVLNSALSTYDVGIINANFAKVQAELQNKVLYRDNPTGEPNTLETDVNANNKRIYNLPEPTTSGEPLRLEDLENVAGDLQDAVEASEDAQAAAAAANISASSALSSQSNAAISAASASASELDAENAASSAAGSASTATVQAGIATTKAAEALASADSAEASAEAASDAAAVVVGSVRFDVSQSLTVPQKTQAQTNIGVAGVASDIGAAGDGVTDDTAAVNAAIIANRQIPPGTYLVSTITFQAGAQIIGSGSGKTTLKLKANTNADVLVSQDAYTWFGNTAAAGTDNWRIEGITIDGNATNQSSGTPDTCNGLAYYSSKHTLRDVVIKNVKGHGIRSEGPQYGEDEGGIDPFASNVTIDNVGRHGWWNNGPHDLHAENVIISDASQETDNTWCGLYNDTYSGGRFFNFHAWHRSSATNRMQYACSSLGSSEYVASHFEGGRKQFQHRGTGDRMIGCLFYGHYGAAGTALVSIEGQLNQHEGCWYQGVNGTSMYAIEFKNSAALNRIDGYFQNFDVSSPFLFTSDGGINRINGIGYSAGGGSTSFGGTKAATTEIYYDQGGTAISTRPPMPASVLTGSALPSSILSSSLTSLGTLGSLAVSGQATFAAGSAAAPSVRVGAEQNGLYSSAANRLDFVAGGVRQAQVAYVASAVNYLSLYGATAGGGPTMYADGSDAAVNFNHSLKGAGSHVFYTGSTSAIQAVISHTAGADRWITLTGSNGGNPTLSVSGGSLAITPNVSAAGTLTVSGQASFAAGSQAAPGVKVGTEQTGLYAASSSSLDITVGGSRQMQITGQASAINYWQFQGTSTTTVRADLSGSSTNISAFFTTKGSGSWNFSTGGTTSNRQVQIADTASAVNYLVFTGSATGGAVTASAVGSDTDIDYAVSPKGAGVLRFGTHSALAAETVTGYITIKDSAGNTRKLAVVS